MGKKSVKAYVKSEVLDFIESKQPFVTTKMVMDKFGMSRTTANKFLSNAGVLSKERKNSDSDNEFDKIKKSQFNVLPTVVSDKGNYVDVIIDYFKYILKLERPTQHKLELLEVLETMVSLSLNYNNHHSSIVDKDLICLRNTINQEIDNCKFKIIDEKIEEKYGSSICPVSRY